MWWDASTVSREHLHVVADSAAAVPAAGAEAGKELARVAEGGCFGERALQRQEARAATVRHPLSRACMRACDRSAEDPGRPWMRYP